MKSKKEINNKKVRKMLKIDFVVILCILGLIILALIAVLPPLLRVMLEDRVVEELKPEVTPEITDDKVETDNQILVCKKIDESSELNINITESYYLTNNVVTKSNIIEEKEPTVIDEVVINDMLLSCSDTALAALNIPGVDISCARRENKILKTQTVEYLNLDLYILENIGQSFYLEFKNAPTLDNVKTVKTTAGYICEQENGMVN